MIVTDHGLSTAPVVSVRRPAWTGTELPPLPERHRRGADGRLLPSPGYNGVAGKLAERRRERAAGGPRHQQRARHRRQDGATYLIWGLQRIGEALGMDVETIRLYIRHKGLPVLQLGGYYVTSRGLIDLWLLTKIRERG